MKLPVLLIGGSTDLQVDANQAKKLFSANPKATLQLITDMNHVLKKAPADKLLNQQTYNNPDLPLHQDLVPILVGFVNKLN